MSMKRAAALVFAVLLFCAVGTACRGSASQNTSAPSYVPYEPFPPASTAPTTATVTTSDYRLIPTAKNYPETAELRFTRAQTPVAVNAERNISAQGYVIYLSEEYEFVQFPGVPDVYQPNPDRYPAIDAKLYIQQISQGTASPAKVTEGERCMEYIHKTVGDRIFEIRLIYALAETETIRPLLLAMVDSMRI